MSSLDYFDPRIKLSVPVTLNYRSCFRWSIALAGLGAFLFGIKVITERHRRKAKIEQMKLRDNLMLIRSMEDKLI